MSTRTEELPDEVDVEDLLANLERLESTVDSSEERRHVRESMRLARRLDGDGEVFGQEIRKYTSEDLAEGLVGAVVFAVPLLVEGGVFEIAEHFLRPVFGLPLFALLNLGFAVGMTTGLLYWAEFQDVTVYRPLFGLVPRRLVGVLGISLFASVFLMTLWGRAGWHDPGMALARVSVVWTVAAFGAGLGDILPGESDSEDLTDRFEEFVQR
jgi:uncharacterized membrane protein